MSKNNVLRSLQSFALFPIFAANLLTPAGDYKLPTVAVLSTPEIRPLLQGSSDNKQKEHEEKVAKVKAYFADRNLPAADYAEELVTEAEKNNLPWSFVASFMMNESTGCKFHVKGTNNCFGWGGGKIKFDSIEDSIETVAWNLGGNNPVTAKYYKDKTLDEIIDIYNPPTVNPSYKRKIKYVMDAIENYPVGSETLAMATS